MTSARTDMRGCISLFVLGLVTACGARQGPKSAEVEPAAAPVSPEQVEPAPTRPEPEAKAVEEPETESSTETETGAEAEALDLDYAFDPFDADLDADGKPERIEWVCEDEESATLRVGADEVELVVDQSEHIGCEVVVFEAPPGSDQRLLLFISDQHEEIGPPTHFLFVYAKGTLRQIWEDTAEFEAYDDGSWRSSRSTCYEDHWETTTTINRWVDGAVSTTQESSTSPNEYGCDDP